jgi:methylthioxylose transferase
MGRDGGDDGPPLERAVTGRADAPARGSSGTTSNIGAAGSPRSPGRVAVVTIAAGSALIILTHQAGRWLQERGYRLFVNAPPLTGNVEPRASLRSVSALTVAALAIGGADRLVRTLPWRRLLWTCAAAALAWSTALAAWDGIGGFTRPVAAATDYLAALPLIGDVGEYFRQVSSDPSAFPSHVRAHPPGFVMMLVGLARAGLATPTWVAVLEHVAAASSVPAVLLATREVASERVARSAAAFVVFTPAAVAFTSGDVVYMALGSWSVCLLVLATGRQGRRSDLLALGGGVLAAAGLFSSYGLVLLAAVPLAVAIRRRRIRPLAIAVVPLIATVIGAALWGFWWFDGLNATRRAYAVSAARSRPYLYFLVANLAAALVALGPAVWVSVIRLRDRSIWVLTGGALLAILLADLSGLSKAEVERIWLPFFPWVTVAVGAVMQEERASIRRTWLGVQVVWTLGVQALVLAPW